MLANNGYIKENLLSPKDYVFGGATGITDDVLCPDGNWLAYLPDLEVQNDDWGDTYACVSFAMVKAVEIILKKKYGISVKYSPRALAKMSGTKHTGNEMSVVAETIRTQGLILESDWPLDYENCSSWDDFYKDIPANILARAQNFLEDYDFKWEWVYDHTKIGEALTYAPLVSAVYAYPPLVNSVYQPLDGVWPNHNMVLYADDSLYRFYDNYKNDYKNYSLNYKIGAITKFSINKKGTNMPKWSFDNNTLIQLVEGTGGFGLYLDGKIITDDLDKILATWLVRNAGNVSGKVRAVTQEVWDSYKHYNLKNEEV